MHCIRKFVTGAAGVFALALAGAAVAQPLQKVTYNMSWLPQGSSIGPIVAQAQGYYKEVGLDVGIELGRTVVRGTRQVEPLPGAHEPDVLEHPRERVSRGIRPVDGRDEQRPTPAPIAARELPQRRGRGPGPARQKRLVVGQMHREVAIAAREIHRHLAIDQHDRRARHAGQVRHRPGQ